MDKLEFIRPEPRHAPELGRICFEAFKAIHDRHAFPRDFPTIESATRAMEMLTAHPDFHGVAAVLDGRVAGSNFLAVMDEVGGVGPITVDPAHEGRGIGRALMQAVLNMTRERGVEQVKLLQDSFNTCSLSLYASLGFVAREPIAVMEAKAAALPDETIRPVTEADLTVIDALSRRHFRFSRRNETASLIRAGFPAFLRERGGRATGYLLPGFFGHGAAETEADAIALLGEMARKVPADMALFFCPLTGGELFRAALRAGCRTRKMMTYMTLGPFQRPETVWMPSILH